MAHNQTGFVLLHSAALAEMALQSIQLGISLQNTSDLHMDKIDQNQLETMRATFIRFQAPEFLKGAILETDKDAKCSRLTTLVSGTPVGQIIQTHVQPFIIIFTLITNCVTSIVLTRPAMRNPTNTFLFGIAIADLLTVLLPLPIYLSSLTSNLYREQLSPFKGYAVSYLATLLPTMFHTSAIWITVLLAVQRFIYVQYPLKANGIVLCQTGPVKWFTFSTVLFALLFQLPQMIFLRYHRAMSFRVINQTQASVPILHSRFGSIVLDQLCVVKCTPLDARFMFILLLCRVTFVHVIPSVLLTILTGQLIVALHRFAMNRRKLLNKSNSALRPGSGRAEQVALVNSARLTTVNGNQTCKSARKCSRSNGTSCSETDSTSRMMLVVLGIFLLVELPTTACICFYAFSIILKRGVSGVFFEIMELCNFLVVLSYPANFFVYLAMSRPFRQTLQSTFPWCWEAVSQIHSKCACHRHPGTGSVPVLDETHRPSSQPIDVG